jgi:hypothetical protein
MSRVGGFLLFVLVSFASVAAAALEPNDPLYWTQQRGRYLSVDAPAAWDLVTDASSVVVAVIDSGINYDHADLADNAWLNLPELQGTPGEDDDGNLLVDDVHGYDFVACDPEGNPSCVFPEDIERDADPMDEGVAWLGGHGTAVAGSIGARGNNSIGVSGMAWRVQLMALRAFGALGYTACDDVSAAVAYALSKGADVINISGQVSDLEVPCPSLESELASASAAGVLVTVSAGNDACDLDQISRTPHGSAQPYVMVIALAGEEFNPISCYGRRSVDIASTTAGFSTDMLGGYDSPGMGTSFAAPLVAGAAALLKAHDPALDALDLRAALMAGAEPLPSLDGITVTGGRLNVANALAIAQALGPDTSDLIACDDGLDNDGDGLTDWQNDPGCAEQFGAQLGEYHRENPQCDDAIDNDGDGLVDHPQDPGCLAASDVRERGDCEDGLDNDGDGLVDGADACPVPVTTQLEPEDPACEDGVDNDGDGAVDHPADTGCPNRFRDFEDPKCSNGIDDDGDAKIDWNGSPPDPECNSAADNKESCGLLGIEPFFALLPAALRRVRRRAAG